MFCFLYCVLSRGTIFLSFRNFLLSGFFAFWVSLIRRKNWWGEVSYGSYWTGSNGSDPILSGSSEGLILLIFMAMLLEVKKVCVFYYGKVQRFD